MGAERHGGRRHGRAGRGLRGPGRRSAARVGGGDGARRAVCGNSVAVTSEPCGTGHVPPSRARQRARGLAAATRADAIAAHTVTAHAVIADAVAAHAVAAHAVVADAVAAHTVLAL